MAGMKVLDGDGNVKYVKANNSGDSEEEAYEIVRELSGGFQEITSTFDRPDNATPYTAKDCLAPTTPSITTNVFTAAARKAGGKGTIVYAEIASELAFASAVTMVVYNSAPSGGFIADNSAFDVKAVDTLKKVGEISFPTLTALGAGAAGAEFRAKVEGLNIPFVCDTVDDLYYQLMVHGTPTPGAEQEFTVKIGVIQD